MDARVKNPFKDKTAPSMYHECRPYYHETPFTLLKKYSHKEAFYYALDVACGTGHSSEALLQISDRVTGIDASIPMIEEARRRYPQRDLREGRAEELTFPANTFDLVNISMGLHWVDHEKFIPEVYRVLKPGGIFTVDNYGFGGIVSQNEEMQQSHFELFEKFLPSVPKNTTYPKESLLNQVGLTLVNDKAYEKVLTMGQEEFTNLIKTMSNFLTLSAVEKATVSYEMDRVYTKIFNGSTLDLKFGGRIKIYSK